MKREETRQSIDIKKPLIKRGLELFYYVMQITAQRVSEEP
jgi:hypothetical protein